MGAAPSAPEATEHHVDLIHCHGLKELAPCEVPLFHPFVHAGDLPQASELLGDHGAAAILLLHPADKVGQGPLAIFHGFADRKPPVTLHEATQCIAPLVPGLAGHPPGGQPLAHPWDVLQLPELVIRQLISLVLLLHAGQPPRQCALHRLRHLALGQALVPPHPSVKLIKANLPSEST